MKIAVISDTVGGGAAVACRRLVRGLQVTSKHEVVWFAVKPDSDEDAILLRPPRGLRADLLGRLAGKWELRSRLGLCRERYDNARRLAREVHRFLPDVIHLHNLHQSLDIRLLRMLPNVPIVWTLHDMWPLTGYCCYSYECDKFVRGCPGECPQAGKWWRMTARSAAAGWKEKDILYREIAGRLSFLVLSRWMEACVKARFGDLFPVHLVPNGIDLRVFRPLGNRDGIRSLLGIPEGVPVLMGASRDTTDVRKGGAYIEEAVQRLNEQWGQKPYVVAIGDRPQAVDRSSGIMYTGRVRDERLLNYYYNAADVFVLPTLADNLPNTLLEALAAGTPCVTFDVGGCRDAVQHKRNGYVARYKDAEDLAAGIAWCLNPDMDSGHADITTCCREIAIRNYDICLQVKRMCGVYGSTGEEKGA